eukprot:Rmarinus@m.18716
MDHTWRLLKRLFFPFVVEVEVADGVVTGTPLWYDVTCTDDTEWDETESTCVETELPGPPLKIILICVSGFLVLCIMGVMYLRKQREKFEALFELVVSEVMSILMSGVAELFDVLSDVGALVAVFLSKNLSSYAPWYAIIVSFTLVTSGYYFIVLTDDLKQTLRSSRRIFVGPGGVFPSNARRSGNGDRRIMRKELRYREKRGVCKERR